MVVVGILANVTNNNTLLHFVGVAAIVVGAAFAVYFGARLLQQRR